MNKTGYPSIDKTHLKDVNFFDKHPYVPSMSIYDSLKLISMMYRDNVAVDSLEAKVTYQELFNSAINIAKAYKELGIKNGDIIAVSMPNYYEAISCFLAANSIGATLTFLNPYSSKEELINYLNKFSSPILINYDKTEEYNKEIKEKTKVRQVITLQNSEVNSTLICKDKKGIQTFTEEEYEAYSKLNGNGNSDYLNFNDLLNVGSYYKNNLNMVGKSSAEALILFTSGTTGAPKSVVLTNKNVMSAAIYLKNTSKLKNTDKESSLVCVPFCYPYGFCTSTIMTLLSNSKAILGPNLNINNLIYFLRKNPNRVFGSPALLELIKRCTPEGEDLSSIREFISGGDFLTEAKIKDAKEFFKNHNAVVEMHNGSGNAETVACGTNSVGLPVKEGTVGKILYGVDAIIMNEDYTKELKYNEEGLLCVSGGNVFKYYYGEPEKTKEAFLTYKGKKYFKTETRGFLDEDGYFTLTGRKSRFFIQASLCKVYCDQIQNVLSNIDVIKDVAVVGKPDKENLYVPYAYIVLKDGIKPNKETFDYIINMASKEFTLSDNKKISLKFNEIPEYIKFCDSLPRKEDSGKVDYLTLEENVNNNKNNEYSRSLHK